MDKYIELLRSMYDKDLSEYHAAMEEALFTAMGVRLTDFNIHTWREATAMYKDVPITIKVKIDKQVIPNVVTMTTCDIDELWRGVEFIYTDELSQMAAACKLGKHLVTMCEGHMHFPDLF